MVDDDGCGGDGGAAGDDGYDGDGDDSQKF